MPETDMMSNVLDYGRPGPANFWASRLGHAVQFATAFVVTAAVDLGLYIYWALSEFMDAPPDKPVPAGAVVAIGLIGLMSLLYLLAAVRRPVSWPLAGGCAAVITLSVIQLVGLVMG